MLKLTKTIIDTNRNLIGFMVEGKEKELGGFSNQKVERGVPTQQLIKMNFSNNQIYFSNSAIVEKGSFKISQLPVVVYTNNGYIEVDNTVNIIKRFVMNNENIGFRVSFFDGSEDNFKYDNLLRLCRWFKPGNFAVRTSSKGRQYICGKNGTTLDNIPADIIGGEETGAKRMKSAAKDMDKAVENMQAGFDILDIYDFIASCGGCVIKLPNEKYVATTEDGNTSTEGFTSLGIGEVASAYPMFNATKLNVNAGFKQVGVVDVNTNGANIKVTSYVFRTKCIFYNGDNYMKVFGIAVPTENEQKLLTTIGRSLALEKLTDTSVTQPLGQVIDCKSLAFYKVDTSKIDLISKDKRNNSILSASEIAELCKRRFELKLIEKAVGPKGGIMKDLKDVVSKADLADASGKKVAGAFAMYSEDGLKALQAAGIDIYTGAYTVAGSASKKSGSGSDDDSSSVEIEYTLDGFNATKLTGSKILQLIEEGDTSVVGANVFKIVSDILSISDDTAEYIAASNAYKEAVKAEDEINKKFWMHNASMYINGGKAKIHTHDASKWSVDAGSKVKTATVYRNSEVAQLTVKFKGVAI